MRRTSILVAILTLLAATGCRRRAQTAQPSAVSAASHDAPPADSANDVTTDRGVVRGVFDGDSVAFRGIPFAAPPVGAKRLLAPDDVAPWKEPRDASAWGACCPQLQEGKVTGSEDCLTLNVWKPKSPASAPRPVLVFIHGGGNIQGCSAQQAFKDYLYDGDALATARGAVVVTFNYRLGALGFLEHEGVATNVGIRDQIAALEWVHRNVAAFGGDPSKVLLFGESAGAEDTCVHVVSPHSKGLFSRALMESAICPSATLESARAQGDEVAKKLGCDTADALACLRQKSAEDLVRLAPGAMLFDKGLKYAPVVDGDVIVGAPLTTIASGGHNHVPFIIGDNSSETLFWMKDAIIPGEGIYRERLVAMVGEEKAKKVLAHYPVADYPSAKDALVAATTDAVFVCPARTMARAMSKGQSEPVYRYLFSHVTRPKHRPQANGAQHGLELLFVFHRLHPMGYEPTDKEVALSDTMMGLWSTFADRGDPNADPKLVWPHYDAATDPYLELDDDPHAAAGLRTANCDFWDELGIVH